MKLEALFAALFERNEESTVAAVRIEFGNKFDVKAKADIKTALPAFTGAGKVFTNSEEAEAAYVWFLDQKGIKYYHLNIKKGLTPSIRSEVWDIFKFIETPAYPFNRDVAERSKKKDHLNGEIEAEAQKKVAVVRVSAEKAPKVWTDIIGEADADGFKTCKIDGHSRTESWLNGRLEAPESVHVDQYDDLTDEQVEKLYVALNSPATAETAKERTQHLNKVTHFNPQSKYVLGQWKTAFEKCGRSLSHDKETIEALAPALMVIDGWNINSIFKDDCAGLGRNGVKRALINSLVTFGEDGKPVFASTPSPFWKEVLIQNVAGCPEVAKLVTLLKSAKSEADQQQAATDCFNQWVSRTCSIPSAELAEEVAA